MDSEARMYSRYAYFNFIDVHEHPMVPWPSAELSKSLGHVPYSLVSLVMYLILLKKQPM